MKFEIISKPGETEALQRYRGVSVSKLAMQWKRESGAVAIPVDDKSDYVAIVLDDGSTVIECRARARSASALKSLSPQCHNVHTFIPSTAGMRTLIGTYISVARKIMNKSLYASGNVSGLVVRGMASQNAFPEEKTWQRVARPQVSVVRYEVHVHTNGSADHTNNRRSQMYEAPCSCVRHATLP